MRVGDRVRHIDVIGATGRVLELRDGHALVQWTGYTVGVWTPVARLVRL